MPNIQMQPCVINSVAYLAAELSVTELAAAAEPAVEWTANKEPKLDAAVGATM
jgi:hypothetical protein